jgi:hypothetical protein
MPAAAASVANIPGMPAAAAAVKATANFLVNLHVIHFL